MLLNCHKGCNVEAVCDVLGLQMSDLFPATVSTELAARSPNRGNRRQTDKPSNTIYASTAEAIAELARRKGPPSGEWTYLDANGEPAGMVLRRERHDGGKDIRPISRHADGWRIDGMPEPRYSTVCRTWQMRLASMFAKARRRRTRRTPSASRRPLPRTDHNRRARPIGAPWPART